MLILRVNALKDDIVRQESIDFKSLAFNKLDKLLVE
jgi:hypothetical protein